ncbi:methyltransferase family protein [Candidatus Altiarchaeota archaeon]
MKTYRVVIFALAGLGLLAILPSVIDHTVWMLGGGSLPFILKDRWDIAAINIGFFCVFLLLTKFKRHVNWRSRNIYVAFIVALFAEMYGFPLTAYFVANYLGVVEVDYRPQYSISFNFLDVTFTLPTMMIVGGIITILGLLLVILGWYQVYKSKGEAIVTAGIYKYSRHPQYVGFMLVTFGWIIHWPTILTLLMWPVLAVTYYRLSREEEKWLRTQFPKELEEYIKNTPMFV